MSALQNFSARPLLIGAVSIAMLASTTSVSFASNVTRGAQFGALGRTRTANPLIRSQMLYPLSYERLSPHISGEMNV